jgi:hypothetical protein
MGIMRDVAWDIMTYPVPDDSGWCYCPEFLFVAGTTP